MEIISHRGYWLDDSEKNHPVAFKRSFGVGLGTETDVREFMGRLVISHDIPTGNEPSLTEFLDYASNIAALDKPITLALNIKTDGIAALLSLTLSNYPFLDYFVFDMSVPDMRHYFNLGIPIFTRMSEVERHPAFLDQAAGVWLDAFEFEWYDNSVIEDLVGLGKRVCIVSAELHGRSYFTQWTNLKMLSNTEHVILCTDNPLQALDYFKGV